MSYDMIDRFLRNNLGDDDYAEYSAALDEVAHGAAQAKVPLTEIQKLDIVTNWFSDEADITRAMQMLTDFEQTSNAHGIGEQA